MARPTPPNGRPGERPPEVAPPGSRERSESDVTGWSPERDEDPELREGRFHRNARLRMAQPRTTPVEAPQGPYGEDDRADQDATGRGVGPLMGEQDTPHSLERRHPAREYRPWNRTGYGGEEHPARHGLHAEHGQPEPRGHEPGPPRRGAEPYSGVLGMGPTAPTRAPEAAPPHRRGRWHREPLTARELMTRSVRAVRREDSLRQVARIMRDEDCSVVPVVDERQRLLGLISERDIVLRAFAGDRDPEQARAGDVMTAELEAVTPDEDIHAVIEVMGRRRVQRVPVVERDDRLVGIISMADIATRADKDEELQEALGRLSARRSFWSRWF
jgi:CBS domain-containing protein